MLLRYLRHKKSKIESHETQREHRDGWHKLEHYIMPIVLIPLAALAIKQFSFQLFRVEGSSMEQLLSQNDRLIIEKVGKTTATITRKKYVPNRFDIIVFNLTEEAVAQTNERQFVKRVIGLPGERVVVSSGHTIVYSSEHPGGLDVDEVLAAKIQQPVEHSSDMDITVPLGHVFVMGDNRKESYDSREMGPIDSQNIVGKLVVRFAPIKHFELY